MPTSASALQATHKAAQDKVLAQKAALLSSPTSSFPLDNIAEGTWTLFSPALLALQPARFFAEYDPECDEWVLELYDTDFANELYPGSFAPGELLVMLHVGERHVQFAAVRRPEVATAADSGGAQVEGCVELVQSFNVGGNKTTAAEEEETAKGKHRVTAQLRFLGEGCLVLDVPVRDLVDGRAKGGEDEKITLYGTFEEDGEDEFEYIAAGEGEDGDFA